MQLSDIWISVVDKIKTGGLLTKGDLRTSLRHILNAHPHARERFAVAFLAELGFADLSHLFVQRSDFVLPMLGSADKELVARRFRLLEQSLVPRELWQSAIANSAVFAVSDYVEPDICTALS